MQTKPLLHAQNPRKVDFSVIDNLNVLVSGLESGYRDPGLGIRTFKSGYPDTYVLHYSDFCKSGYRDPSVLKFKSVRYVFRQCRGGGGKSWLKIIQNCVTSFMDKWTTPE